MKKFTMFSMILALCLSAAMIIIGIVEIIRDNGDDGGAWFFFGAVFYIVIWFIGVALERDE